MTSRDKAIEAAARAIYAGVPNQTQFCRPNTSGGYDRGFDNDPWEDAPDRHDVCRRQAAAALDAASAAEGGEAVAEGNQLETPAMQASATELPAGGNQPFAWHWWGRNSISTWPVFELGAERPVGSRADAIALYTSHSPQRGLEERCKALEAALKPFAELGDIVLVEAPADATAAWSFAGWSGPCPISLDAFRTARAAINPSAGEGEKL